MDNPTEKILDAAALSPAVKFQTIMKTFQDLKDGETFILQNNFDPQPLYMQLTSTNPENLIWDYIEKGPDIYKIRIAKENKDTEGGFEEKVLDAICLNPSVKFQTIMNTFSELKEGETFILHNDHDPKPLFYKLKSTQGDTFTWDYLKEGPDVFEIRIGKKVLDGTEGQKKEEKSVRYFADHINFDENQSETLRTLAAKDYRKAEVFRKYGIDYAWKGNRSITEACEESEIEENELIKALQLAEKNYAGSIPSLDYYHWNMAFLADYILQTHHQYVKDNAERISQLAERTAREYGERNSTLKVLGEDVRPMIKDFMVHMSKEEDVLFPAIKQMLQLLQNGKKNPGPGGDIAHAVEKMEAEHDETRVYLEKFRKITENYELTPDSSELQKQLYRELQLFENDTYLHVHLENNILFPKLIILESRISE